MHLQLTVQLINSKLMTMRSEFTEIWAALQKHQFNP